MAIVQIIAGDVVAFCLRSEFPNYFLFYFFEFLFRIFQRFIARKNFRFFLFIFFFRILHIQNRVRHMPAIGAKNTTI